MLNNRAGASAANRQRVMEAAKQLGYLPMADSVTLPSRPAHLEFFLPIGSNAFMAIWPGTSRTMPRACRWWRPAGSTTSTASRRTRCRRPSRSCRCGANGVGVIAVDHPRTRNILRDIVEAGIRLVTLVSDVPATPRSAYVGIDNRVAGRTAALLMGRFLGEPLGASGDGRRLALLSRP